MVSAIVYLNGKFLPEDQAVIPVSDRGFLFGDGIFTTIKVSDGHPEFLGLHLIKFVQDCEKIGIIPRQISENDIAKLIEINEAQKGTWRLKIAMTGGLSPGINLAKREAGQFLMTVKPYAGHVSTCKLVSYPHPISYPMGKFKSLSYLDRLSLADYAQKQGYDDVLVYDHVGMILESSVANIFWRIGKDLYFPDSALPFYQGVTLQIILAAAENAGMKGHSVRAKLNDISDEAHVYLCNSLKWCTPIVAIDEKHYTRDLLFEETLENWKVPSPYPCPCLGRHIQMFF